MSDMTLGHLPQPPWDPTCAVQLTAAVLCRLLSASVTVSPVKDALQALIIAGDAPRCFCSPLLTETVLAFARAALIAERFSEGLTENSCGRFGQSSDVVLARALQHLPSKLAHESIVKNRVAAALGDSVAAAAVQAVVLSNAQLAAFGAEIGDPCLERVLRMMCVSDIRNDILAGDFTTAADLPLDRGLWNLLLSSAEEATRGACAELSLGAEEGQQPSSFSESTSLAGGSAELPPSLPRVLRLRAETEAEQPGGWPHAHLRTLESSSVMSSFLQGRVPSGPESAAELRALTADAVVHIALLAECTTAAERDAAARCVAMLLASAPPQLPVAPVTTTVAAAEEDAAAVARGGDAVQQQHERAAALQAYAAARCIARWVELGRKARRYARVAQAVAEQRGRCEAAVARFAQLRAAD